MAVKVKVVSKLDQVFRQIGIDNDKRVETVCNEAIWYAQRLGPYAPERMALRGTRSAKPRILGGGNKGNSLPPVTGNLGRSITASRVMLGKWQIGTETGYGAYVELGTRRAPAYPFLRPAIERAISEIKK